MDITYMFVALCGAIVCTSSLITDQPSLLLADGIAMSKSTETKQNTFINGTSNQDTTNNTDVSVQTSTHTQTEIVNEIIHSREQTTNSSNKAFNLDIATQNTVTNSETKNQHNRNTQGINDVTTESTTNKPDLITVYTLDASGPISTTETTSKLHINEGTTTHDLQKTTTETHQAVSVPKPEPTLRTSTTVKAGDVVLTTKIPENCMISRAENFTACFEALGENAMKYMASQDLTGFLADICNPEKSRPHMECIKRHFTECPDFQNRIEVQLLQFGPFHIRDIIFLTSVEQMCVCAPGFVCIQKLIHIKQHVGLTSVIRGAPWEKIPNYEQLCDNDTVRYIGCVRKNLRQCQSPLTMRYKDDFTNEDAENLKRMYLFTKDHCDTVKDKDFRGKYECIYDNSRTSSINACVRKTDRMKRWRQLCQIRDCVTETLESECDKGMVKLYIDAVNIYRHGKGKVLNYPCSSCEDFGLSALTLLITFLIVLFV